MTYRRPPNTFAAAMTSALTVGEDWLAQHLGVSRSRLRQCANPMTNYMRVLELGAEVDIACASRGLGTPIFDEYRRRLVDAGAVPLSAPERRAQRLAQAIRAAVGLLLNALRGDETQLEGVAA